MAPRLGILGGTYDPVHVGHVASARETADAFELDQVLLVLSARPPHKLGTMPAATHHRMAMLELAAAGDARLKASDIEVRRPGPSYTIDTLVELRTERPDADLYLVLGLDAYLEIDSWERAGRLLEHAHIVVTNRPGTGSPAPDRLQPPFAARSACCYDSDIGCHVHSSGHTLRIHHLRCGVEVSASAVRERVRAGLAIEEMVGSDIAAYIHEHRLYRNPA